MPIRGLPSIQSNSYPAHFSIEAAIRPNILALHPYRCARDDYQSGILLDANENALGHSIPPSSSAEESLDEMKLHRYPDPAQVEVKKRIAELRGLPDTDHIFLGVGSDEIIDLLMRVCCVPEKEKIITTPPTYGMYAVCAQVNDLPIVKVPLRTEGGAFQLQIQEIQKAVQSDPLIKLIILCSPGNPTGTLLPLDDIRVILEEPKFKGIVVVDEAYVDFSGEKASAVSLVRQYANLCVMQTLSKSFGLAAIRLGIAIAQPPLIQVLSNTKAPYNISTPSAALAHRALAPDGINLMRSNVAALIASRTELLGPSSSPKSLASLSLLGLGTPIGGNDANFVLIPVLRDGEPNNERAGAVYKKMAEEKDVVVRFRGNELGCKGCLRITVGKEEENTKLLAMLKETLTEIS